MSIGKLIALFTLPLVMTGQNTSPTLRERAETYLQQALAAGSGFVNVSSASGMPGLAAGSLATAFGTGLASETAVGAVPYGTVLGGVSVQVVDSAGTMALARILYVSPSQINYEVPATAAAGQATVNLIDATGNKLTGTALLSATAPAIFTANGNGMGVVAATAYRQTVPTTLVSPVPVFSCPSGLGSCVSVPIDTGVDQPVTLTLYATGLRSLNGKPASVTISINGQSYPARVVAASDEASPTVGIDEVSLGLPISLRGAGEVTITLAVGTQTSNSGTIRIQ